MKLSSYDNEYDVLYFISTKNELFHIANMVERASDPHYYNTMGGTTEDEYNDICEYLTVMKTHLEIFALNEGVEEYEFPIERSNFTSLMKIIESICNAPGGVEPHKDDRTVLRSALPIYLDLPDPKTHDNDNNYDEFSNDMNGGP